MTLMSISKVLMGIIRALVSIKIGHYLALASIEVYTLVRVTLLRTFQTNIYYLVFKI